LSIDVDLRLFLYRRVGGLGTRFGPWAMLSGGLLVRGVAVVCITGLAMLGLGSGTVPILVCFGATQVIWPLLAVSGNTLAVTLRPARRAERPKRSAC
jgi:hypothetical protein